MARTILKSNSHSYDAHSLLVAVYKRDARWADHRLKAHRRDPHLLLGEDYIWDEKYDLAEQELNKAIETNPNNCLAYTAQGKVYYYQGRNRPDIKEQKFTSAIEMLRKAIEINLEEEQVYLLLAEIYFDQGRNDFAANIIRKLLEIYPTNAEYRRRLSIYSPPPLIKKYLTKYLSMTLKILSNWQK